MKNINGKNINSEVKLAKRIRNRQKILSNWDMKVVENTNTPERIMYYLNTTHKHAVLNRLRKGLTVELTVVLDKPLKRWGKDLTITLRRVTEDQDTILIDSNLTDRAWNWDENEAKDEGLWAARHFFYSPDNIERFSWRVV